MYINQALVVTSTMALGVSLILIIALAYANTVLLQENRFLKQRLRAWRTACRNHVEVPF
jgi:hypothetical protein